MVVTVCDAGLISIIMDKFKSAIDLVLWAALLALIVFGIYKGGSWVIHNVDLSPKTLAVVSLVLILVPIITTLALATQSKRAYTSSPAAYSVMVLPVGILGLVVSGAWYLLDKLF
jgi:hypothetical protein